MGEKKKEKDLLALNAFHSNFLPLCFMLCGLLSEALPFPNWHSEISNHSYWTVPPVFCVATIQQKPPIFQDSFSLFSIILRCFCALSLCHKWTSFLNQHPNGVIQVNSQTASSYPVTISKWFFPLSSLMRFMFLILATDWDQGSSPFYQNNHYLEESLAFT